MSLEIFNTYESEVRGYIRSFPKLLDTAQGAEIWDTDGKRYIDFFAGAGALNYGHNNPIINEAVIKYLQRNGIGHALDMATVAKKEFIESFVTKILQPRHLNYKLQFVGPTGTNAIETALKIARKVKGRKQVMSFTNGFHGMSMGSLSITGNQYYHDDNYGVPGYTYQVPFHNYLGDKVDTIAYLRKILEDNSSGTELPAAIVLETIQAEGGINVSDAEWLKKLRQICDDFDILLIADDIQVGNGRSGDFFSFERAGIKPDIITLSKSIGAGQPMAMVLLKPELDKWSPGEHSGTFRGNSLAFVGATAAIDEYWADDSFSNAVKAKAEIIEERMKDLALSFPHLTRDVRGHGFIWGIEFRDAHLCSDVCTKCFEQGLIIETAGSESNIIKFLAPLITTEEQINEGFDILKAAIQTCSTAADY